MDKQEKIIEMFNSIAPSYDRANRILSLGIDIAWRKDACKKALSMQQNKHLKIADIACGTGDMILHWEQYKDTKEVEYFGIDPSKGMLEVAKEKLKDLLENNRAKIFIGQAQNLEMLEDESMDIVSIAYGIRNVVGLDEALSEFARVLKPRGLLVILEFTKKEQKGLMDKMMGFYTKKILPFIGGIISRNYKAYAYLPDSIDGFLSNKDLIEKIENNGLKIKMLKSYSANISTLFIATKE
ncbi:bifunctional demethylmenaquinone methyltransferase/2-methoxy-6-polyprenyl-1,4-benzoquinol methylase UbiE [Helicobacter anatolicus]|uniref:bifunctional demethylmenaquinone methyltransferase/2-methoxy-6-polyprenyl-1,4-benzoquinol methylase UbiE n=1 Tax=Helicobacter anatolicus TaxID=2905874 RepID=UPI001E3A894D|nr:bifunctional demethylmenaquinone methyltransferase/2-methoxy-6-polyprenyl-1,4-benzoquinol methylase UbiE [Helicobacter anatolicus]MCE3038358.1 bifunctional demethylmenaquinone methyltransferase/2-methoxy-6-polyprenyl-1,4-benzoquinol methylase UbiE [Helicobacter anatolicus]MCE3039227.1 bifunctional demethylmenaquinone methyltransferase/2-methoxy-6-polyprenyl-1,4-benzoquinol methylase UbiE [Helicobacter anatolicus]